MIILYIVATPTMEPGKSNSGVTERAPAGGLLFPHAQEAPMEAYHGIRGDRSDAYVSDIFIENKHK